MAILENLDYIFLLCIRLMAAIYGNLGFEMIQNSEVIEGVL
jgi:hypothetical protein